MTNRLYVLAVESQGALPGGLNYLAAVLSRNPLSLTQRDIRSSENAVCVSRPGSTPGGRA